MIKYHIVSIVCVSTVSLFYPLHGARTKATEMKLLRQSSVPQRKPAQSIIKRPKPQSKPTQSTVKTPKKVETQARWKLRSHVAREVAWAQSAKKIVPVFEDEVSQNRLSEEQLRTFTQVISCFNCNEKLSEKLSDEEYEVISSVSACVQTHCKNLSAFTKKPEQRLLMNRDDVQSIVYDAQKLLKRYKCNR